MKNLLFILIVCAIAGCNTATTTEKSVDSAREKVVDSIKTEEVVDSLSANADSLRQRR